MARLRLNAVKARGPVTLREDRALAEEKTKAEAEAKEQEERQALTFDQFFEKNYLPIASTHKKKKTMTEEKSIYGVWLKPTLKTNG